MKGLELCRDFYEEYGVPMLKEFSDVPMAVGMLGGGSECLGYDDETSQDHDFAPGFCVFLPDEQTVDRRTAFLLERAYAKLPKEYGGVKRAMLDPVGGARQGIFRLTEYFGEKLGTADGSLTDAQWFSLPQQALLEATNGEVWRDDTGALTALRRRLAYYPEDVRRKKLAGHLLLMAQSGQYNFTRCLSHGEVGAAQLAAAEFVKNAISAAFLLERRYEPYYKWAFRAMRELPQLRTMEQPLVYLLSTGAEGEQAEEKQMMIEAVASTVIDVLQTQELTKAVCGDLEKHAYSVNDAVRDPAVRNLHILAAV
ncbi:MAG: DUF4037 domain-containing protein [Oscillospiraceae bacterium]|nr:DUF4037 domain-containing protein [Oscillospiraceae bacterium]